MPLFFLAVSYSIQAAKYHSCMSYVHPWLIHVSVWQKPPQYCEVISLQLKLKKKRNFSLIGLEVGKSKIEASAWLGESLFPGSQSVTACCIPTWWKGPGFSGGSFS